MRKKGERIQSFEEEAAQNAIKMLNVYDANEKLWKGSSKTVAFDNVILIKSIIFTSSKLLKHFPNVKARE